MASSRTRRVAKELGDIEKDTDRSGITASPADASGDLTHLKARITGPPGTAYEGGQFVVDVKIPPEYPFRPPVMKFDTKVWHPNISSQTGAICLDTLSTAWSPVLTIKSTLLSLQSLFESPEPKDPQDAEVARMMMTNKPAFEAKAHEWAVRHAGAPQSFKYQNAGGSASFQSVNTPQRIDEARYGGYNRNLIDRFVNMGFDVDRVVESFLHFGIDRNDGVDYILEEAYMGDVTARLLGEP
ncbi:putative Ubiquitin-conjugating enzyme/RWD-like protein [Seiridium cardinale]|uniref:Ubiquitin-conjugating enzyme E2 2 n=1 Tax=Seiridium cardinale TaxID=138064 RepID=A0ABR2Y232_9PEZI